MLYFWGKQLMEIWYLLITEKFFFQSFRKWKIRSFLEPKTWLKYDIYWLLKGSCFELFGDGKYGLFWVKTLVKIWYLLVTEKFLFWTFRWCQIRSLLQPKSWWKDDIYIVFWGFYDIPGPGKYGFSRSVYSCLPRCQKSKSDINLFVKYWWFKNTKILMA